MATNVVSFTIRRPTPNTDSDNDGFKVPHLPKSQLSQQNSRTSSPLTLPPTRPPKRNHAARNDSDSEGDEDGTEDEIITGFDKFGVTRKTPRRKEGPLVIPAVKNKDWRAVARARNAPSFVPNGGGQVTGADGSVGGLGTRDQINSGPQASGLTFRKRAKLDVESEGTDAQTESEAGVTAEEVEVELTEDQKAIKALLSSAEGGVEEDEIAAIPMPGTAPTSLAEREKAAYKRDIVHLPESASLEAYDRVPVSQFGAALLRGMGWKEGQAASRTRKGPVEPWIPTKRPELLGIGAKEKEVLDDGSGKKSSKNRQEAKKYMPLMKVNKDASTSRDRSPDERSRDRDQVKDKERDRNHRSNERNGRSERRRSGERDHDSRRDKERDRHRETHRHDRDRKDESRYESERDGERRKYDRERDRGYHSDRYDERERNHDRGERKRDRGADKYERRENK